MHIIVRCICGLEMGPLMVSAAVAPQEGMNWARLPCVCLNYKKQEACETSHSKICEYCLKFLLPHLPGYVHL